MLKEKVTRRKYLFLVPRDSKQIISKSNIRSKYVGNDFFNQFLSVNLSHFFMTCDYEEKNSCTQNCVQKDECSRVCHKSTCSQSCNSAKFCSLTCSGQTCQQNCNSGACNLICSGRSCTQSCNAQSSCRLTCIGTSCRQICNAKECQIKCLSKGGCNTSCSSSCILHQPTTQAAKTEASSTDGSTKKAVATDVTTPQGEFIQGSTTSHILVKTTESK